MNGYLARTLRDLRSFPWLVIGALVALLVSVAATVTVPQVMKEIINSVIASTVQQQFALAGSLMILGLGLVRSVAGFTQNYLLQRAGEELAFGLRKRLFTHLQGQGFSYHDTADTGQLITRLGTDVDNVSIIANTVGQVIQSTLILVVTAIIILIMNWQLALVTLIVLPPMAFLMWRFQQATPPLFGQAMQKSGMLVSVMQENIINTRVVRVFGREAYQLERFRAATQNAYEAMMKIMRLMAIYLPVIQLFALAASAIVIGVGGYSVIYGNFTIGELVAFNGYVSVLVGPIFSMVGIIFSMARSSASAQRVYEVLDQPTDIAEKPNAKALPAGASAIVFDNVSFRYNGATRDALENVSFKIAPGQLVVVLGQTGSGKSSIAHLLSRFYDVTGGAIRIGDQDIRDVTLSSLRSQIGMAFQTPSLFTGTIRENIAYGKPNATLEDVKQAAQMAQADKFIDAMPLGYDTELGEGGAGLSGGQKQRLTLARTLLMRPSIFVLDDSMSALDAQTKHDFAEVFRDLAWPCTKIVIGEHAGLLAEADQVLVLDHGKLSAEDPDTHLQNNGLTIVTIPVPIKTMEVAPA